MDKRLELRVDEALIKRLDAARGDASRSLYVRRAVERALGDWEATAYIREAKSPMMDALEAERPKARTVSPRVGPQHGSPSPSLGRFQ